MFVNLQQGQILHNIIFNNCKFILNVSLTGTDRVAQWEREYPVYLLKGIQIEDLLLLTISNF